MVTPSMGAEAPMAPSPGPTMVVEAMVALCLTVGVIPVVEEEAIRASMGHRVAILAVALLPADLTATHLQVVRRATHPVLRTATRVIHRVRASSSNK